MNKLIMEGDSKNATAEFFDLVARCYAEDPDEKDLMELRKQLTNNPELWMSVFDMTTVIRRQLIEKFLHQEVTKIGIENNIKEIKRELDYAGAPVLEQLMIDNVINSWIRQEWVELQLTRYIGQSDIRFSVIEFWEKRISATQRRYLRACETLARVRKLTRTTPMLQVNIATQEGQQINVAGDLAKEIQ